MLTSAEGDLALVSEIEALGEKLSLAKASIDRRFIGQEKVVELVLSALLCGGHALLVGCRVWVKPGSSIRLER